MTPESTGEARAGLAAFPGIADVTVIELDAGQCLIAYVVPSGPGLDVPELRAHARKTLRNGSMPAVIMVFDEISATEVGAVKAVALPAPELSGPLPYKAPAAGSTDRRSDHMADARK